jgi:transcriptional regulator with XRE-family HTH domain
MPRRRIVVDLTFGALLRDLRESRGLALRPLAARVLSSKSHLAALESGTAVPTLDTVQRLDEVLGAGGALVALVRVEAAVAPAAGALPPWETTELLRRIQASDTSAATIESLHATVSELCCGYGWRLPAELRAEGLGWMREVERLLHQPTGLTQHRELLVAAGWLALLIGCCEYDMGSRSASEATRVAARELGAEAGHAVITGWSHEMSAWFALTQGRYAGVITASQAGQAVLGEHPAAVQLLAQEAKARARTGDAAGMRVALDRGRHILDHSAPPDRPDHHFVIDPDKLDYYAMDAARIVGDDTTAKTAAHAVLVAGLGPDGVERAPMRMAEARLTLAVVAARAGELERAVQTALSAFVADRKSLPSLLMIGTELADVLTATYPTEPGTRDYLDALRAL